MPIIKSLVGQRRTVLNHGKIVQSSEGEFYWGSNDGVVAIQPLKDSYLPQARFEIVQGTKEEASRFNVYNYSYNHQDENGIAYKFFHPDSSWNYLPGDKSVLDFSHLDKGAYQLNISAINADGIINNNSQTFKFQIKHSLNTAITLWLVSLLVFGGFILWYWKTKRTNLIQTIEEEELFETPEDKIYREWLNDDFMQKSINIIEENLSDNAFGVNELYIAIQMSKSNFYRKLKKFTDLSPNELIRFVRLRKSAHLLVDAKQTVNEIAYEVGFNSPSYFTRCFKQQFGIAPSEYKEHYFSLSHNAI